MEMEIEELKKAVLSDNNSLSSIIRRYLDLAKKLNLDHDITKWLHNELYGYDMYYQGPKMKELDGDQYLTYQAILKIEV